VRRLTACVTLVSLLATSVPAWAADPLPRPAVGAPAAAPVAAAAPSPPPTISPLKAGQAAPYSGVLLSPGAVAQIVAQQDTAQAAIQLVVQHQVDVDGTQQKYALATQQTTCDADKKVLQAQVDDSKKQNLVLTDQLKKNTGGPGAGVWIGLGAVGGIVATVLLTFAISKVTK
jgi:hypothetical protein